MIAIAYFRTIGFYLIAFAPFTGLNLEKDGSNSACSPMLLQSIYSSKLPTLLSQIEEGGEYSIDVHDEEVERRTMRRRG